MVVSFASAGDVPGKCHGRAAEPSRNLSPCREREVRALVDGSEVRVSLGGRDAFGVEMLDRGYAKR